MTTYGHPNPDEQQWWHRTACEGTDLAAFYPPDTSAAERARARKVAAPAIALCGGCPVRTECLDDAMQAERGRGITGRHGVRGGLTPEDRVALERGPKPAPQPRAELPPVADHGTPAGASAHRRRGEKPCDDCAAAARDAKVARRGRNLTPEQLAARTARIEAVRNRPIPPDCDEPSLTTSRQHHKNRERPCNACRAVKAAYEYERRRKAAA